MEPVEPEEPEEPVEPVEPVEPAVPTRFMKGFFAPNEEDDALTAQFKGLGRRLQFANCIIYYVLRAPFASTRALRDGLEAKDLAVLKLSLKIGMDARSFMDQCLVAQGQSATTLSDYPFLGQIIASLEEQGAPFREKYLVYAAEREEVMRLQIIVSQGSDPDQAKAARKQLTRMSIDRAIAQLKFKLQEVRTEAAGDADDADDADDVDDE